MKSDMCIFNYIHSQINIIYFTYVHYKYMYGRTDHHLSIKGDLFQVRNSTEPRDWFSICQILAIGGNSAFIWWFQLLTKHIN